MSELKIEESWDYPFPGRMFHVWIAVDPSQGRWDFIGGVQEMHGYAKDWQWAYSRDGITWTTGYSSKEQAANTLMRAVRP